MASSKLYNKHEGFAPSSMSNYDLSAYTIESGNKYVFQSDGYVWVNPTSGAVATVHIYAKDGSTFTYVNVSSPNVLLFPVYKGMMVMGNNFQAFRFVQFNY